MPDPLSAQMHFLLTCDRLKNVIRTTTLHDGSRFENSAEHSWHLALMALTLSSHAPAGTHIPRVVELLLVHDLVEIYAGDTFFAVAEPERLQQHTREQQAARDLFGLLPEGQGQHFQRLWEEFEAQDTPEARFAKALDALQPMLLTWGKGGMGCSERHPDLTREKLLHWKEKHLQGFPALWEFVQQMLVDAEGCGILPGSA